MPPPGGPARPQPPGEPEAFARFTVGRQLPSLVPGTRVRNHILLRKPSTQCPGWVSGSSPGGWQQCHKSMSQTIPSGPDSSKRLSVAKPRRLHNPEAARKGMAYPSRDSSPVLHCCHLAEPARSPSPGHPPATHENIHVLSPFPHNML